jgi:hypothetical protein
MKRTKTHFLSNSVLGILSLFLVAGCDDDDDDNTPNADMYNISATLNGANEKPNPITTNGTGTVTGTYNATTNSLQYSVSWTGLTGTASAGHFHGPASATAVASPIIHFNLVNSGTAGTANGTITLTDAQETDFLGGMWYANVHTATNSGGEIRGQVSAVK